MLVFKTPTIIPLDAFTMFGLNAKMKENPIGFFGTGLKYAVAITLRLGGTFRLFRGTEEYEFYVSSKDFRGKEFQSVRMRKKSALGKWGRSTQLPFTLELGKNWDAWMAVRELESNTRDEDGSSWAVDDEEPHGMSYLNSFEGAEGLTTIWVDCPDMEKAFNDGSIFLDTDLPPLDHGYGVLEIYDAPSDFIYMNGIRVETLDYSSAFTYNFTTPLELTEDRSPKQMYMVRYYILKALQSLNDPEALDKLFALADNSTFETRLDFDDRSDSPSPTFHARLQVSGGGGFSRVQTYYQGLGYVDMTEGLEIEMEAQEWQGWLKGDRDSHEKLRELVIETLEDHGVTL